VRSILIVCEGNICRSPMAEGLMASALPQVMFRSAGLGAMLGSPADEIAVQLMLQRGIDISAHRARQINRALCLDSDMVLVMEREQRQRLEETYPEACGRVFRLGEHINQDVPDPYRKPAAAFEAALAIMEDGISHWVQRIRRL
jgi:protein-tyrosine phosphatase